MRWATEKSRPGASRDTVGLASVAAFEYSSFPRPAWGPRVSGRSASARWAKLRPFVNGWK